MKNALLWLAIFLIIALSNVSCAVAMGRRSSCDAPVIPTRPDVAVCVSNGNGTVSCFDPRLNPSSFIRPLNTDDICRSISDHNLEDNWISDVLRACK